MINLKALNRSVITRETLSHVINDDNVVSCVCVGLHKMLYRYTVKDTAGKKYTLYVPKSSETPNERIVTDVLNTHRRW